MVQFWRNICNNFDTASSREWLVTNGIGGYASGTIAGVLTRRYHGLLIAALKPPLERTLLVSKYDASVLYDGEEYPLFTNHWGASAIPPKSGGPRGAIEPQGYLHIESFRLEGTTPVWTFANANALLEKRIWMEYGKNTTYVRYNFVQGSSPLELRIKAIVNYRDHHASTRAGDWEMQVNPVENGLRFSAHKDATPYYLLSSGATASAQHQWYQNYYLSIEAFRGLEELEDNLYSGEFQAELMPGNSITLVASTEPTPNLDGNSAFIERQTYEQNLLAIATPFWQQTSHTPKNKEKIRVNPRSSASQLILAADQFIVQRPSKDEPDGRSIIAGYPWFGDWGRDTMIALPGLTLTTGRPDVARGILRTYARFVDRGMLPNRFPEIGEQPEYNTVDATLWYFEALRLYHATTGDDELLAELFPVLVDIMEWHQRGTRYSIHMDPVDGLLYAGEPGVQLTWMDAKVGDWVVTPRIGKPVEINALWHNALRVLAGFAERMGDSGEKFHLMAERISQSLARFWNGAAGFCFDVIDGPDGDDSSLRPNQLLAVSLPNSPLTPEQCRQLVDACAQHLLTPHGLRSLAPFEADYQGLYGGNQRQRDGSYHQGIVWGWMIGPFVAAHLRVYQDKALARSFLSPLIEHLKEHGVGSISEIFDGGPPFTPRGCTAQAWSVAEVLRVWEMTDE